jgi:D-glycero-beta-D-manno-heptose 1-phosphate adenylyltransferase
MNSKIVEVERLSECSAEIRDSGRTLVVTNGCFDLLHVGHVRYLQAAKALGDVLLVGINGDESTRQLKGAGRPVNKARDRAEVIAALECVDLVAIFPEMRATRFLELAQPNVYVKGGDYTVDSLNADEREVLRKLQADVRIIPFEQGYSTSTVLKKLEGGL